MSTAEGAEYYLEKLEEFKETDRILYLVAGAIILLRESIEQRPLIGDQRQKLIGLAKKKLTECEEKDKYLDEEQADAIEAFRDAIEDFENPDVFAISIEISVNNINSINESHFQSTMLTSYTSSTDVH